MEEWLRQCGGAGSHEDFGSELGGSHEREGTYVVMVGVRDEDSLQVLGNFFEERSGVPTVLTGVHSGVQEDRMFTCAEEVGVGTDFRGTRQVGESDHEKKWGGGSGRSASAPELHKNFGGQLIFRESGSTDQPVAKNFAAALVEKLS
jgi:hypothetical protein